MGPAGGGGVGRLEWLAPLQLKSGMGPQFAFRPNGFGTQFNYWRQANHGHPGFALTGGLDERLTLPPPALQILAGRVVGIHCDPT